MPNTTCTTTKFTMYRFTKITNFQLFTVFQKMNYRNLENRILHEKSPPKALIPDVYESMTLGGGVQSWKTKKSRTIAKNDLHKNVERQCVERQCVERQCVERQCVRLGSARYVRTHARTYVRTYVHMYVRNGNSTYLALWVVGSFLDVAIIMPLQNWDLRSQIWDLRSEISDLRCQIWDLKLWRGVTF